MGHTTDSTRVTEGAKSDIKTTVTGILNALKRTNPHPSRERMLDVHTSLFVPEVLEAARIIWKHKEMRNMVKQGTYANLSVNMPTRSGGDIKMTFTANFPHKTFVCGLGSSDAPPMLYTNPYYDETEAWVKRCVHMNHQLRAVTNLVEMVLSKCTTYGQLARIWPMLTNAVPDTFKERLANAKRQVRISPFPWQIADRIDDYRKALRLADVWIAEALMFRGLPTELAEPWCDNYANITVPVLIDRVKTEPFTLFDEEEWPWSV